MGLLNLFVRFRKTRAEPIKRRTVREVIKKNLSWGKLFALGKEMNLFGGNKVTEPYKQVATIYKAIKAIADNIPQAKIIFVNKDEEEIDDPLLTERFARPNGYQSINDFLQEMAGYYSLYGEVFLLKDIQTIGEAAGTKLPALVNLNPKLMSESVDYSVGLLKGWKYGTKIFAPEEIIHIKDFNPYNKFRGLSPLAPIDDEMQLDQDTITFNKKFFESDATPSFVLSTDKSLSDPQRKRIEEWWRSQYAGLENKFKMAVLEGGLKAEALGQTHKDMEFIEQKRLTREEILGIWRSPKALFNITEDLNYATFVGQMKIFWLYTLMPILQKFKDGFNAHYIKQYRNDVFLTFDIKNVPAFAEDFKEKVTTGSVLFTMGFTGNEINSKLDLGFENKPWRNEWWIPFGQTPASAAKDEGADGLPPEDETQDGAQKTLQYTPRQRAIIRSFLARQSNIEDLFHRKLKRYFYDLRSKMLNTSNDLLISGKVDVNWDKQDDELVEKTKPMLKLAIDQGVAHAEAALGSKKSIDDDALEHKINSYLAVRADKITGINRTLQKKVFDVIAEITQAGGTITDIAAGIKEEIRNMFNNAATRSRLIARTETVGAVNGGSLIYYQNEGVEKKEWLTANDEFVRESHARCQGQGAIDLDKPFKNGLMYPGDQNGGAAEVCNCRCTIAPVVE